jgi:hypothetical protein
MNKKDLFTRPCRLQEQTLISKILLFLRNTIVRFEIFAAILMIINVFWGSQ